MAENMTNMALSRHSSTIANRMKDGGTFLDALSAAKFGMAYAIKYYWDDINTIDEIKRLNSIYDTHGNNYNIGSIDPDKHISQMMAALYPDSDTPYTSARVLMCYGLNKLGDMLEEGRLFPIHKVM